MAVLESALDLINDALFRVGEIPGASEWDAKAIDYINREHRALCSGAHEFLPEYINDWWWMRARGVLTILPTYSVGTVSVVQDSLFINFDTPPLGVSLQGRRFKVENHGDQFQIAAHNADEFIATLDSPFTGDTNPAAIYMTMQLEYALNSSVQALLSPVASFTENPNIMGLTPERMDTLFPMSPSRSGVPQAFCLENDQLIRFSHGGRTDGRSMRFEYNYRPAVIDLIYSGNSLPLVPLQYRHVLADMICVYLFIDKNDDRATAIGTSVRSSLGAMAKENTRRLIKIDQFAGQILPRSTNQRRFREALRTESGLIIG